MWYYEGEERRMLGSEAALEGMLVMGCTVRCVEDWLE
jgi:hypothetical protein